MTFNRNEYPDLVANEHDWDIEPSTLDAFCKGYARALLWADAYREVPCDEHTTVGDNPPGVGMMLERDEDASYAYDSPGRWWEGMGIDYTDAVAFLRENMSTLHYLPRGDFENDWDFWGQHGHDFLLTRNRHGTGFWDRGYPDDIGNALAENAKAYGEHQVLTDDSPRVSSL